MVNHGRTGIRILLGMVLLLWSISPQAQTGRSTTRGPSDSGTREKILRYVREKFGLPDPVKVTIDPLREFSDPHFYETAITADDGKQKRTQKAYVTKDRRFLILGNFYPLGSDPTPEITRHVREDFKLPEGLNITVGPFRNSPFPDFLVTMITLDDGKQRPTQNFYVTKDSRFFVAGNIFNLSVDPRREVLRTVKTVNQPSMGPANAPVTIVEYTDYECPSCARLHELLEKDVLPKYGSKVRVVFKDLPLGIHAWSLPAAIAGQCAYQIDPEAFRRFRTLVFQHQGDINAANVRDMLLTYGEQAGLDRLKLAACLDSKATLGRIEENAREAKALGVTLTPTSFINGKMVVGAASPEEIYKVIDDALRAAR